jgi:hypothetical protein
MGCSRGTVAQQCRWSSSHLSRPPSPNPTGPCTPPYLIGEKQLHPVSTRAAARQELRNPDYGLECSKQLSCWHLHAQAVRGPSRTHYQQQDVQADST